MCPEERIYPVLPELQQGASIRSLEQYRDIYQRSVHESDQFWAKYAARLEWFYPYTHVQQCSMEKGIFRWFSGGKLNAAYNCIDRHLEKQGDQTAILWEADEPGQQRAISYGELHAAVCQLAGVLRHHGVNKGDRVILYMPMIPELAYAMLACARIGAVHSIVFAGFSAESVRDRILDSGATLVITADEGLRGGKCIPLKRIVDEALQGVSSVRTVLVAQRTHGAVAMQPGRDVLLAPEMARMRPELPAEWMDAEDPLFILYTSGSTGKPKGLLHTVGGYLTYVAATHRHVFDYRPGDIYFCAADIGWITGHSYIIYGPLANGATTVMFESTPLYPDPGRYWETIERLKVNIFYTAPTAIRALAREGEAWVKRYDRSSLRVLGSVGEPINPQAWEWYYRMVGEERCALVDTWWQTETGGIMITPLPGVTDLKPGSASRPFFGIQPVIVDEQGQILSTQEASGYLCLAQPWPGMARTIYGDHQRFLKTYFEPYPGLYFTGDGCRRDRDGYYWITGRVDDVLNVSGHRLGTAEVESAINGVPEVAESAVVGFPHEIKGQGIFAFVILKGDAVADRCELSMKQAIEEEVTRRIGKLAKPDVVLLVPGLPKTRSGKIMRRILRKIAEGEYQDLGNLTTLADPEVVERIIAAHRGKS